MSKTLELTANDILPDDYPDAVLIGRAWLPKQNKPVVVTVKGNTLYSLGSVYPTITDLLEDADRLNTIEQSLSEGLGLVADIIANSAYDNRNQTRPWLLAPTDLQPVKASGVTFAASLVERLIEERASGDPLLATRLRTELQETLGFPIESITPGSEQAKQLKKSLQDKKLWSQYLEVGLGPDAEIFTKALPMSSVGLGAEIGILRDSEWNNPEPEIALLVTAAGQAIGATLANDVNLRDYEGRSALLLGKAKDNNASSAIGPFIRLFDKNYSLDSVRKCSLSLEITGADGFELVGSSHMDQISRDPETLISQLIGKHHQYPDGVIFLLGTLFAPTQDRDQKGHGFTHKVGDLVRIHSNQLGALVNRVNHAENIEPWQFGIRSLIKTLND